ncbi:MAG TPA: zinc ABC transporter substrate-binding protein, partial [Tissierellaceae bacterium]
INDDKIKVVTTLFPQYDFSKELLKEHAKITILLPPGVEAHSYDPTPKDIVEINNSDIFIYTGDEMEPWVSKIINNIDTEKVKVIDISKGIELIEAEENDEAHGHSHEKDPHFWTNPKIAKKVVSNLSEEFVKLIPEFKEDIEINKEDYIIKLEKLDNDIRKDLERVESRTIIYAGHFALGYFAEEYNLEYITPYDGFSPNSEPSPKNISNLIEIMNKSKVKSIFYEELIDPKVARIISEQTGANMYLLHGAHNISKDELDSNVGYIDIMYNNLENLKLGLGYHE